MPYVVFHEEYVVQDENRGTENEKRYLTTKVYRMTHAEAARWEGRGRATMDKDAVRAVREANKEEQEDDDEDEEENVKPVVKPPVVEVKPVEETKDTSSDSVAGAARPRPDALTTADVFGPDHESTTSGGQARPRR